MIFLITENNDKTSDIILEWLFNCNSEVKRLNVEKTSIFNLEITNDKISCKFNKYRPSSIFIRRGKFNFITVEPNYSNSFKKYLYREHDILTKSVELTINKVNKSLGSYFKEKENLKLLQLSIASECGLKIPSTLVTNEKKRIVEFKKKYKKIISKDICYPINFSDSNDRYTSTGTFLIKDDTLEKLSDTFFPILAQEYIDKKYEIRIFFFKDKFYSMAIFSQQNEKTIIDFRNYDKRTPNRCVPYSLPNLLLKKLKLFTDKYEINTGSFDIIKSTNNKYYFLEVNPQGQMDWLSKNCNYYIEKDIAKYLSIEKK